MTSLFENFYVHVMLFTVFFPFLKSYSIPILWVVNLEVDFLLKTPFSISVDPGSFSTSRLSVTVGRFIALF